MDVDKGKNITEDGKIHRSPIPRCGAFISAEAAATSRRIVLRSIGSNERICRALVCAIA